jgi:hypothetical protein
VIIYILLLNAQNGESGGQRRKASTFSFAHAPSHGIVRLSSRVSVSVRRVLIWLRNITVQVVAWAKSVGVSPDRPP